MNITRLLTPFFAARARRTLRSASDPELVQLRQLKKLIANGRRTLWGDSHHLQQVATYDDFREAMPVTSYPDILPTSSG